MQNTVKFYAIVRLSGKICAFSTIITRKPLFQWVKRRGEWVKNRRLMSEHSYPKRAVKRRCEWVKNKISQSVTSAFLVGGKIQF